MPLSICTLSGRFAIKIRVVGEARTEWAPAVGGLGGGWGPGVARGYGVAAARQINSRRVHTHAAPSIVSNNSTPRQRLDRAPQNPFQKPPMKLDESKSLIMISEFFKNLFI